MNQTSVAAVLIEEDPQAPGQLDFASNGVLDDEYEPLLGLIHPPAADALYAGGLMVHPFGGSAGLVDDPASWRPIDALDSASVFAAPSVVSPWAPSEDINQMARPLPAATNPDTGSHEAP